MSDIGLAAERHLGPRRNDIHGKQAMPSGERSQVWYPEIVSLLREAWRPDLSWEAVVDLRGHLQQHLREFRTRRGIVPAMIRCPRCGATAPAASPLISVRAMLLALGRYGIERPEVDGSASTPGQSIAPGTTWTLTVGQSLTEHLRSTHLKGTKLLEADPASDHQQSAVLCWLTRACSRRRQAIERAAAEAQCVGQTRLT